MAKKILTRKRAKNLLAEIARRFIFLKPIIMKPLYTFSSRERVQRIDETLEIFAKDASEQERIFLKRDLAYCKEVYNIKYDEYFLFNLRHKTHVERNSFLYNLNRSKYLCLLGSKEGHEILKDKYKTYQILSKYYKRDVVQIKSQEDFNCFMSFLSKHPVFVKKPQSSSFGKGIELIDSTCYTDVRHLFQSLLEEIPVILEERIQQEETMASLHPSSINTLRIVTYLTPEGDVKIHLPFIKIGQGGSFVDNGGAGGILAIIDADTGVIAAEGKDELNRKYITHPDTGVKIKGFQIPRWNEIYDLVSGAAKEFTATRYIGWDVALSCDRGWLIVEGNGRTEFYGQQMTDEIGKRESLEQLIHYQQLIKENPDYEIWGY